MKRTCTILACLLLAFPAALQAAGGRIVKVLPHYLDLKGRHSLSPSLYERDAYQAHLRAHSAERSALRFDIQWKGSALAEGRGKIRVETRGARGSVATTRTVEKAVSRTVVFSRWTPVVIGGAAYQELGDLVAWRVTLWDGDRQVGEQKSFLW